MDTTVAMEHICLEFLIKKKPSKRNVHVCVHVFERIHGGHPKKSTAHEEEKHHLSSGQFPYHKPMKTVAKCGRVWLRSASPPIIISGFNQPRQTRSLLFSKRYSREKDLPEIVLQA